MSTTKIEITSTLIAVGVKRTSDRCPIALAMRIACPKYLWSVSMSGVAHAYESSGERAFTVALPDSIRKFITDFENGENPQPFSFDVTTPE